MTVGGYGPWAQTSARTVWGSDSGGAGVGTAGLLALLLAAIMVGGRRWPALAVLLLGAFSAAATGYYLVDPGTVASDAAVRGPADAAWGLYLAFVGSAATTLGALTIARLRRREAPAARRR
ncbi:MAG: hypothetical protein ABR569_10245 [Gaiellaceae bacterium]